MIFLQFSDITHEHITGKWKVVSVVMSPRAEKFAFEAIREIVFLPDYHFHVANNTFVIGKWRLEYHQEIIPNPVVYFDFTGNTQADKAMITRYSYMPDKYGEDKNDEMILYFSNGCEIVLEKISG
ncbi:MAG: hypothetical protein ACXWDO_03535 [Bacteroidia bacterium]